MIKFICIVILFIFNYLLFCVLNGYSTWIKFKTTGMGSKLLSESSDLKLFERGFASPGLTPNLNEKPLHSFTVGTVLMRVNDLRLILVRETDTGFTKKP